jgi:hypothetical protein
MNRKKILRTVFLLAILGAGTRFYLFSRLAIAKIAPRETPDLGGDPATAAPATSSDFTRTFLKPPSLTVDNFGYSVAAVGSNVLVGARYDDTRATDAGAAYLFLWDGDANGDGSITQADADLITSLIGSEVSCQKNQVTCHADVDNDLDIDSSDVGASMMSLGLTISEDPDVDGDSDVDIDDLISVFLNQFQQPCPPVNYLVHMDFDNDCDIDIDDLIGVFLSQFKPWPPS